MTVVDRMPGRRLMVRTLTRAALARVVLVALVTLAVAGCEPSAPPASPQASAPSHSAPAVSVPTGAPVDAAGAKAAVARFVGEPIEATVSGPEQAVSGPLYRLDGPSITATVDAQTGRVVGIVFGDKTPAAGLTNLTPAEAEAAARAFLDAHDFPVDELKAEVAFNDHGSMAEYTATWTRMERGIELPIRIVVRVNPATGEVFSFVDFRRAYVEPPDPTITLEDAVRIATPVSAMGSPQLESSRLRVTFDASGTQRLVWEIGLFQPASNAHVLVEVDAITGEARIIGRG